MTSTASKIVTLVLFGYLVSKIVISVIKLQTKEIGTIVTRRNSDAVMFPTMTFCSSQNPRKDGRLNSLSDIDQQFKEAQSDVWSMNPDGTRADSLELWREKDNFVNSVQFHLLSETSPFLELDGEGLKNSTDVATYHVALEATKHHVGFEMFDKTTNVRECVTLKSPGKIELGKKEEMFVPNMLGTYGSAFSDITLPQKQTDKPREFNYYLYVRVKRSHWKTLDQESERCSKELNPDTTGCIVKFIEETAGCTLPIYGANNLNGTKCDTNANLLKLQKMDENGIHGLTGCLASCNKDEFQAELSEIQVEEIESETGSWGGGWDVTEKRSLKVFIHFLNGRYEEKEQYIIYDSNTMIADIGGYMGLLLGYSLLSIYEIAEQMWLKIISMSTRCTRKIEV